ncbi:MAG: HD-GYP domain-containing protein [Candidatus Glassbacteria bacterium]|nr:HD-GYP domain-containing protein [Candidatus Glassbacteria bacterium]
MAEEYFPVPLKKIVVDSVPNFDLYIRQKDRYVLYRKAKIRFENKALSNLMDNRVDSLYVSKQDLELYEKYRDEIRQKQEEIYGKQGFSGCFVDPAEVERYHDILENYHVVNSSIFDTGQEVDFTLYYHEENEVVPAEDFEGKIRGPWELTRPLAADKEIMIRNEDRTAYRDFVKRVLDEAMDGPPERQATALREMSKMVVKDVLADPRSGDGIKQADESVTSLVDFILDNEASFYSLMKVQGHDYYTYVHSMNVCTFSVALGTVIGLPKKPDLEWLGLGGMLHDVGKSMVDSRLINKPGRLTEEEFKSMKDHVIMGYNTLKESHDLPEQVLEPVIQHHEKLTGIGYPHGIKDGEIGTFGRISSIVDIYDALTTERSYKKALSPFEALSFLSKTRHDYDNDILNSFIMMLGKQIERGAAEK